MYNPVGMVKFLTFSPDTNGVPLGAPNTTTRHWDSAGDFDVTVSFSKYGFRDAKDFLHAKGNALFVVGDSFSFGYGVEEQERYSNVLETMLSIPIYNLSIPTDIDGYEKLIMYAQKLGANIPHLILGICMENDLKDYDEVDEQKVPRDGVLFAFRQWLATRWALYNAVSNTTHQSRKLQRIVERLGIFTKYPEPSASVVSENVVDSSVNRLVELRNRCHVPRITVLIVPSRALWVGDKQEDAAQNHLAFIAKLQGHKFDVLDPFSAFNEQINPVQYYHFKHDGHWNIHGHQKVAHVLYDHLQVQ